MHKQLLARPNQILSEMPSSRPEKREQAFLARSRSFLDLIFGYIFTSSTARKSPRFANPRVSSKTGYPFPTHISNLSNALYRLSPVAKFSQTYSISSARSAGLCSPMGLFDSPGHSANHRHIIVAPIFHRRSPDCSAL